MQEQNIGCVGMYNLITYEMARTVNALTFFYVWMKEYIFALFIQCQIFLSACVQIWVAWFKTA